MAEFAKHIFSSAQTNEKLGKIHAETCKQIIRKLAAKFPNRRFQNSQHQSNSLELPQIAENGNTVPLSIEVESPMSNSDHVKAVHIFAEGNPAPEVASFHFSPANGIAKASVRIRLAQTQNVIAVAELSDGSILQATTEVKVTIGGCGG